MHMDLDEAWVNDVKKEKKQHATSFFLWSMLLSNDSRVEMWQLLSCRTISRQDRVPFLSTSLSFKCRHVVQISYNDHTRAVSIRHASPSLLCTSSSCRQWYTYLAPCNDFSRIQGRDHQHHCSYRQGEREYVRVEWRGWGYQRGDDWFQTYLTCQSFAFIAHSPLKTCPKSNWNVQIVYILLSDRALQ